MSENDFKWTTEEEDAENERENERITAFFNLDPQKTISVAMEPVRYTGPAHTIQGCPADFGTTQHIMFCPLCSGVFTYCNEHHKDYFASHICVSTCE